MDIELSVRLKNGIYIGLDVPYDGQLVDVLVGDGGVPALVEALLAAAGDGTPGALVSGLSLGGVAHVRRRHVRTGRSRVARRKALRTRQAEQLALSQLATFAQIAKRTHLSSPTNITNEKKA